MLHFFSFSSSLSLSDVQYHVCFLILCLFLFIVGDFEQLRANLVRHMVY
uniref:Uncharacterized protein n=1 Tax=Daphnia magna TaxID=35525 RepID=A0A0P6F1Q8_9CRUS